MTLVRETVVDGVRTMWVDSGRPTLLATLMFRAGRADEVLTTAGWLHLLEHLALHGLHRGSLAVNGSVSTLETTFTFHGPAEQVVTALAEVTRRLTSPDMAELDRERRVLAAEASTRGGPVHRALGQRYGARGPGLAAYDDVALGRATPELLHGLARSVFVASNASLALDGPPPADLGLDLAEGDGVRSAPAAVPVEHPRTAYMEPVGLVLSGVVTRSAAHTFAAHMLEDALRRRLREQDGTSYAPYSLYEAVDADHALVLAGADVSPTTAPSLLGNVIDLTDALATHGPDPEALADVKAAARQAFTDPYNIGFLAHRAAAQALQGRPVEQLEDVLAEHDAIEVDTLVPALSELRDSLIVGAPPGTAPHRRLTLSEQPVVATPAKGTRSASWPADDHRLGVTDTMLTVGDSRHHYQYDLGDLAGYFTWDNGARRLVLHDGWGFTFVPTAWARGDEHVRRLDDLVKDDLHLPQPDETAPEPAERDHLAERLWRGLVRWSGGTTPALLIAAVVLLYPAALVLAVVGDLPGLPILATIAAVLVVKGVRVRVPREE